MTILAVDDEQLARELMEEELMAACPDADVRVFSNPEELLECAKSKDFDVIITDIQMPQMDGITLSKKIKEIKPDANIIFLTAYDEYAVEAIGLHASGYLTKPVTRQKIENELADLRYDVKKEETKCKVRCYGNFEIFGKNGLPIHFKRSKSKEALAYIVHRKGAVCTIKEVAAVLFEDAPYDLKQMRYIQKILSALIQDMEANGYGDVIVRQHNGIAVDVSKLDCDYYDEPNRVYENGDEYMAQYSWAEYL